MSIKRSREVINLCSQGIEENRSGRRLFRAQIRHPENDNSESSDEFRILGIPSITETLSIGQIIAISVLLGIQIYLYFVTEISWKISWFYCLLDWGSLLLFYGTGIFTFATVKCPTKFRFQWSLAFQITSGFVASVILTQAILSTQNDVHEMQEKYRYAEKSTLMINFIKIAISTLMIFLVCIIIFLLSRATACCSHVCCGFEKRTVAFDMTSESQPSHSQP